MSVEDKLFVRNHTIQLISSVSVEVYAAVILFTALN